MTAKILVFDIERIPMRTKSLPVWDMKGLQYRRLSPGEIDRWGRTICLAYRWLGERRTHFLAEWQEGGRIGFLTAARDLLDVADVVVGHNSTSFDVPHLTGEFILEGLTPPSPFKRFDTLLTMRKHGNLEANHLDTLDKRFGFSGKTDKYRIEMAEAAAAGDLAMQRKIERYNKGDIAATVRVYDRLKAWGNLNLGIFQEDPSRPVCPACGGAHLQRRGYSVKVALRYPRYQCTDCGKWMTSKTSVPGAVAMRPA
jgi:predicted RNA-binding Zn-ribbon protein involved in translation (DUF1610 family)